jgi:hypothetical protein
MTHRRVPRWLRFALALAILYFLIAYVIVPQLWKHHERKHPDLRGGPTLTHTASGIPGDPRTSRWSVRKKMSSAPLSPRAGIRPIL